MNSWRSKKPKPSESINFTIQRHSKLKFDNGLNCYFVRKDVLPIVRINVIINSGSKYDPESKKGLANLLAMCIDEGAGEFDALQLSEQFDLLGAQFSIYANADSIQIVVQTLTENFSRSIELLSKVLMSPHLHAEDFEREKRKILTRLQQLKDDPDFLASTAFEYYLLGNKNPYSFPTLGFTNTINNISNKDISSFYRQNVLPGNTFFVVTGNLTENTVVKALDSNFNNWQKQTTADKLTISKKDDKNIIYVLDKKDSVQTEIRIGHQTSGRKSGDYFAKQLLNTILGGQFTSRINLNLREKHGYTYGAGSAFNYFQNSAYFLVSTSVGIENTSNALREIFNELHNIRNGVTEKEVDFAKNSIKQKFPLNFETYSQVASNITSKIMFDLPDNYYETYLENIDEVTIDDINNAAIKYVLPDIAATVLVGDKEKIKSQLGKVNSGEVQFKELPL